MRKDDRPGREHLEAAATLVQSSVTQRLGELRSSFLVRGLLAGALGICVLIWPSASMSILVRLVGLFFIADAVSALFGPLSGSARGANLLRAIVSLAIGVFLLFWAGTSARILMLAFGAWAIFQGLSLFFNARNAATADEARGPLTIVSIILLILGAVLIFWPGVGVVTIAWLIGVAALILAVVMIGFSTRFKRVKSRVEEIGQD
jgi:uncharacterized membrane protein HdeD (DUF308 family)